MQESKTNKIYALNIIKASVENQIAFSREQIAMFEKSIVQEFDKLNDQEAASFLKYHSQEAVEGQRSLIALLEKQLEEINQELKNLDFD